MNYVCENNCVKLIGSDKVIGTVITIKDNVVAVQKTATNGVTYIPLNRISVFSYREVK